jgi:hypothetical protein
VASAIWEFLIGPLADNPRRLGKPLAGQLAGYHSARRGSYRVVYEIIDKPPVAAQAVPLSDPPAERRRWSVVSGPDHGSRGSLRCEELTSLSARSRPTRATASNPAASVSPSSANWDPPPLPFTAELEPLAVLEHQRWESERRQDGWRLGPVRDPVRKVSPYLVPWDNLPEEIKDLDRDAICALPTFLTRAGFAITRRKI